MSASSLHRESTDSLIGMSRVGQHHSHTFGKSTFPSQYIGTQSGIRLHERVPMVKIWGSSKNDQNQIMGKAFKL